jgi:NAD+ synthase
MSINSTCEDKKMNTKQGSEVAFSWDMLRIDCEEETARIARHIRMTVRDRLRKRGVVIVLSSGLDSSVAGALCVRALGPQRVFGLLLPERESSPKTPRLSRLIVEHLAIQAERRDITGILETIGCYRYRDEAIASVIPSYDAGWRCRLTLPSLLDGDTLRLLSAVVESPDGEEMRARLPLEACLQIVAAMNLKQRVRTTLAYFHADRLNFAVAGSCNRLDYDQGLFVRQGDGVADLEPIAHLYWTQVCQMAESLELPPVIRVRPPIADTGSMSQDPAEFYYPAPHRIMDACLYGRNHGMTPESVAPAVSLEAEQVERIYRDIDVKRRATRYQHMPPLFVEPADPVPTGVF